MPLAGREIWIERDDFSDNLPAGWQRLTPAAKCACATAGVDQMVMIVVCDAAGAADEPGRLLDRPRHLWQNPVGCGEGRIHFERRRPRSLPIEVRL